MSKDRPKNVKSSSGASDPLATSRSLLEEARKQEPSAWARLVELYSPLVYYWCQKMDLPGQDIPDVFQEVFQAVSRKLGNFKKQKNEGSFRGWLRVVTRNKILDFYRRKAKEPQPVGGTDAQNRFEQVPIDLRGIHEDPEVDDGLKSVYEQIFQTAVKRIRKNFNDRTWQAFWGMVVDGKSAHEVGDELNMKPGTVRVSKSRVLQRLKQELGDSLDE